MNIEEKKVEIIRALESGEVSQRSIDSTKGKSAKRLREGKTLRDNAVERMYQELVKLRQARDTKKQSKSKDVRQKNKEKTRKSKEQVNDLVEENRTLKATIIKMKKEIEDLKQEHGREKQRENYNTDDIVQGFYLRQEKTVTTRFNKDGSKHTTEYIKYYAKKRIAGKLHRIYIGKTLEKNKVNIKIEAYREKYGINSN